MIRFDQDVCTNLDLASRREWLETNGIGGFASSTITGLNTRRYHGLLVAALTPPVGRHVLLSKLEETLMIGERRYELGTNRYPGVIHPQGYQFLTEFRLDPFPTFVYRIRDTKAAELKGVLSPEQQELELEKTIFLVHNANTAVIEYRLRSPINVHATLELRPLIAFRDYHSLAHENAALNPTCERTLGLVSFKPYSDLPTLHLAHNAQSAAPASEWFRNFQYECEQERGLDFSEDLFNPCVLTFDLAQPATVIAALQPIETSRASELRDVEITRRAAIRAESPASDQFLEQLTIASEQFLVSRGDRKSVIAGYHWFADWGRDTMISLPGLSIPKQRAPIARDILRTFAQSVDRGMLPNRFPDAGETPEYNTVDATLWFFEAIRNHLARTNDVAFVRDELYNTLTDIIDWHVRGTRYNIQLDSDGLLNSGADGAQLTWMDAKVGNWVVTPRRGKPVEIQALWYNALCIMEALAAKFGDELGRKRYATFATLARFSFNRLFWNDQSGSLYDVIDGKVPDPSLRPNQIFAVSLRHTMLAPERAKRVVQVVQEHLLTPYGLRTLAPSDPNYRGRYTGDQASRDGAYHQGTVWPWLLGPFLTAYLKVNGHGDTAKQQAQAWLEPLQAHLLGPGTGQINEIFEGDAPHRPVGCIAQAWSVAELLRICIDDLGLGAAPDAEAGNEKNVESGAIPDAMRKL
jgi:predicted glycogen debranching enzyme